MIIYRGFQVKPSPVNPTTLIVVTDGKGGKIPSVLDGMYTSFNIAQRDIDFYLNQKELKEVDGKKPNKTVSTN